MIRSLLDRCIDAVTRHNRITLLVLLVLTAGVLTGIPQIDTASEAGGTSEEFEDIDRVETAQYIEEQYGNATGADANSSIQAVYVRDEGGNVLSKESLLDGLRYQQQIVSNDTVQDTLHEDGVRGVENLVAMRAAGSEDATLGEQIRALENASAAQVQGLVGQTVTDTELAQQFLPTDHGGSETATDRRILVALDTEADGNAVSDASTVLYETTEEYSGAGFFVLNADAWDDYRSHFFGEMIELVLPAALAFILLVLVFAYRDLVDVVIGMSGVALSVLWMFGLLGWLGVEAGTLSIVPVVLITGLSIDFGFHVFNRYRELRGPDDGIREPMASGVTFVGTALVLVTLTASIGFLANLTNPLPVIQDLGVSITLGVVSALVIFVTAVPALKISVDGLLERIGLDRRKGALGRGTYLRPVLGGTVTLARRAAPVVLVVAVLVAAAGGLAWMELDQESYQQGDGDVAEWKQQLPGPLAWESGDVPEQESHVEAVYQPASADDAIESQMLLEGDVTGDDTLADIDAGVGAIEEEGLLVDHAGARTELSPLTAMQDVAEDNESFATTFQQADTDGDGIPDRNLEALYDGLYAADTGTAQQVVERTDGEYSSVLVTLSLDADFSEASSVTSQLEDGAAVMGSGDGRTATAAGPIAVNEAILDEIIDGVLVTMVTALLAIALALTAIFRYMHGSATLGAVVAVPIVLVVGLVVGGMFLLGIPLTLLTALLMSLVIGLGVDYNIHIGDRFADELDAGRTPTEALESAITGTGGALLGSTLTSAGAFATIALVPNPQLVSFGSIVVIALVTALLVSLLVLPSLLLLWSRYASTPTLTPTVSEDPLPQD